MTKLLEVHSKKSVYILTLNSCVCYTVIHRGNVGGTQGCTKIKLLVYSSKTAPQKSHKTKI